MKKFFKRFLKSCYRHYLKRMSLEKQFNFEVIRRKERNSKKIWSCYYVPLAVHELLEQSGVIKDTDARKIEYLAQSLMFRDMADGKLDEFFNYIA